ncbi:hypothetical protein ACN28S_19630 [Cystobacter fuscus]
MPPSLPPGSAAPLGSQLLAEHFRADAIAREAAVTRFISRISCLFIVSTLGMTALIGWPRALSVAGLCAVFAVYYGVLSRRLRRGWFHPAIYWVNVVLETTTGAFLFVCDTLFGTAEQALGNPMAVLWTGTIVFTALRGKRGWPSSREGSWRRRRCCSTSCWPGPGWPSPFPSSSHRRW